MIFSRQQHQHRHEAIAIAAQIAAGVPFSPRSTVILWRCPCAHVKSTTVAGSWTLAEVRGEAEKELRERLEAGLPPVRATA